VNYLFKRVPQYMTVGLLPTTPQHDFEHHNRPFHGDYVEGKKKKKNFFQENKIFLKRTFVKQSFRFSFYRHGCTRARDSDRRG